MIPIEPTFTRDSTPTDETLRIIETWPPSRPGFLEFCRRCMNLHYGYWKTSEGTTSWGVPCLWHRVSTGGWSDNEAVLGAMYRNYAVWPMYWYLSQRGGYYEFEERT